MEKAVEEYGEEGRRVGKNEKESKKSPLRNLHQDNSVKGDRR